MGSGLSRDVKYDVKRVKWSEDGATQPALGPVGSRHTSAATQTELLVLTHDERPLTSVTSPPDVLHSTRNTLRRSFSFRRRPSLTWKSRKSGDRGQRRYSDSARDQGRSSDLARDQRRSSDLARDSRGSSNITKNNRGSSDLASEHQKSSDLARHHRRSSDLARHHRRSSDIVKEHRKSSDLDKGQVPTQVSTLHSKAADTDNMPTKRRLVFEGKVRFKGRFCADALNEVTMSKLTAAIGKNKGKKTRLKLLQDGIECGQTFGTILRNRLAYEYKPMRDIEDIVVDQLTSLLLVIVRLIDGNYEILAFAGDLAMLKRFEQGFGVIKNHDSTTTLPDVHITENWTLRQNNKPARPTVLNMYTPQSQMNGTIPNGNHNVYRSRSVQDFSTGQKTGRRRVKSRDDGDGLSDASDRSVDSVKKEILNLSREVNTLRSMLDNGTGRSIHDTDSVITSTSSRVQGGNLKKGTDQRRQNGTTLHVDSGYNSNNDGPIHLVYGADRGRPGSPVRYKSSNSSTVHTLRAGENRGYRSPDSYSYRDNASTYSSFYPTTGRRLVTPVPIGPARVYGAAVGPTSDGTRTIYKTKSMDSPNRWKYRDSDWEGSVYSSRTYTAPTRQPRTLERKIYTGHPDFSYVNIVPTRSQSTSRYETRHGERW